MCVRKAPMIQLEKFLQYVSDLNPAKTPARLTFYNYLKHEIDFNPILDEEIVDRFFVTCLDFPHWAQNHLTLSKEVKWVLHQYRTARKESLDESKIRFPDKTQIIEIEHFSDVLQATSIYLRNKIKENEKFSLLSDQGRRVIALILNEDKTLRVSTFDKKFTLRNGRLEPLRNFLTVHYDENLQLKKDVLHFLEIAPYIYGQIRMNEHGAHGNVIRGYVFQKHLEIRKSDLENFPRLYYPLKRLEQFFVEKSTDLFYAETTELLRKTAHMIRSGDAQGPRGAKSALHRGESVLENIYTGDKLLTSLVKELRSLIQSPSVMSNFERAEECQNLKPIEEHGSIKL
ncbi:MAG: hypothetical protein AB7O96_09365 [Pseudobdellovibrionaceae bacterium]